MNHVDDTTNGAFGRLKDRADGSDINTALASVAAVTNNSGVDSPLDDPAADRDDSAGKLTARTSGELPTTAFDPEIAKIAGG